jgi:preprotein translocase subunit SecA
MSSPALPKGLYAPIVYAERELPQASEADRLLLRLEGLVVPRLGRRRSERLGAILPLVHALAQELESLDDAALAQRARHVGHSLRLATEPAIGIVAEAFALVREASWRKLGLRHHDVQLLGGYALFRGMIAEMNTGEGKTLTATLAAVAGALAGWPVHVVTVNDYLAQRDAEKLAPLYAFFGFSVGVVVSGLSREERRAAYACDVTYCTNKELAFDHLKDRLVLAGMGGNLRRKLRLGARQDQDGQTLLMRGLHFAIVDEADSVLIDEARTPLILSGESDGAAEVALLRQAMRVAETLRERAEFVLLAQENRIELTEAGRDRLDDEAVLRGGIWLNQAVREDLVQKALTALHAMRKGEHYVVRDGKVEIVDEYTGRIMAERFWSDGLHQLVELKEGATPSSRRQTLARMTYQRFFRRYCRLSGMSGTVADVAGELWEVYRLRVVRIPTHRPSRRRTIPDIIYESAEQRWKAVALAAQRFQGHGVPVLVGTRSVAASEAASRHLAALGVAHVVLNATDEAREAEIVARAGEAGQVTVATNMAGRGTDIIPGPNVPERGGLLVIMTERHDSIRIDRQLAGRTARQGQPGVVIAMLSLDDDLLARSGFGFARRLARLGCRFRLNRLTRWGMRLAQRHAERDHARIRRQLLRADEMLDNVLALSGTRE